jgi:hypothetical protein
MAFPDDNRAHWATMQAQVVAAFASAHGWSLVCADRQNGVIAGSNQA